MPDQAAAADTDTDTEPSRAACLLRRPVVLVGLMGAGKTSVGKRLAAALGAPFVDSDDEVEAAAGMTIADIFETMGEAEFREGERRVIARLMDGPPGVIATGGGAFMNDDTRAVIAASGATVVWIRAELEVLVERVERRGTRPLLANGDPREILGRLMRERHPVYAGADVAVQSVGQEKHEAVVGRIRAALEARGDAERAPEGAEDAPEGDEKARNAPDGEGHADNAPDGAGGETGA